jgi:hypothetical protein
MNDVSEKTFESRQGAIVPVFKFGKLVADEQFFFEKRAV